MTTSKSMRDNPLFMRNTFSGDGRYGIPMIQKQYIDLQHIQLLSCVDTKNNDSEYNVCKGVHHFVDDYRFESLYTHPEKRLSRYSQYRFLLSPDFSIYADMLPWRQIENVAKNRWVGAYWQAHGLTVIPTISWGMPGSFEYCFDGVEKNSIVAVGMIGCKREKANFLRGYQYMMEYIEPQAVICFGKPFDEMEGNIIIEDYISAQKGKR